VCWGWAKYFPGPGLTQLFLLSICPKLSSPTKMPYTLSWEERAAEKRADVLSKIRPAWRLSDEDLARAKKQRDLTGPFIHSFLHPDEVHIVTRDSVDLVNAIKTRQLSASQVTAAFCKTAAIAHQIVRFRKPKNNNRNAVLIVKTWFRNRITVYMRFFSSKPLSTPDFSMTFSPPTGSPSAHSMACPSVSRTNSMSEG